MVYITVTAPYQPVRLVNVDQVARLDAEQERVLPGGFRQAALQAGCRVEDSDGVTAAPPKGFDPERIDRIVSVIKEIMDTGDPALTTNEGYPRVTEVEARLGHDVTAEERTAAWEKYSGE